MERTCCALISTRRDPFAVGGKHQDENPAMLETVPAPAALRKTLHAAAKVFDLAVIDMLPAAPVRLADVIGAANLVLIPVRPSPDDLRAVSATILAVNAAKPPFAFVLLQAPRAKINEEAVRVLAQSGRVAPVNTAQRVIYAETRASGAGVIETADVKAADEIRDI